MSPDRVFISTVCLGIRLEYEEVLETYDRLGIERVELGYVPALDKPLDEVIADYDFDLLCHNYFLPDEPMFINLASAADDIREWSLSYIETAIDFCASHGIDRYTFHGGFRVDPTPDLEFLGRPAPYEEAFDRFVDSFARVAEYADDHGVLIGVENNVVESRHLDHGENERLMFCRSREFERLLDRVGTDGVGMLLDLGHLKVASETLDFDPDEFGRIADEVIAVHLHDNDGTADLHWPVTGSDWPLEFVDEHLRGNDVPMVLESYFHDARELAAARKTLLD